MRFARLSGGPALIYDVAMSKSEEQGLIDDLESEGFSIDSVWEWVNSPTPASAGPVLVRHLELAHDEKLVEGIARALTAKAFRNAVESLIRKFSEVRSDATRWAIANAIVTIGFPRSTWPDILKLAADPRYGRGRQNLVWRLHRIKRPETEHVLLSLLGQPDVSGHAVIALGYCGSEKSLEALKGFDLSGATVLLRREIPKAIRRIEKRRLQSQRGDI